MRVEKKIGFWKWLHLGSINILKAIPSMLLNPSTEFFIGMLGFCFGWIIPLYYLLDRGFLLLPVLPVFWIISGLVVLHSVYRTRFEDC